MMVNHMSPHLTERMLDWIAHPYTAAPRPVNFVPILVEPIDHLPSDQAQPSDEAQHPDVHQSPQHTDPASTSATQRSDSSSTAESSSSEAADEVPSGNTESLYLTPSEAATNASGPSSESPLITRPSPQPIPPKPPTPRKSPSKGESHHTLHTHFSPIPEPTQPQGVSADFQSTVLQMLTSLTQRLHLIETDVALIKNHILPDQTTHTSSPPTPTPPPPGPPPQQPSPPREPYPDTEMCDASHVSDSLSPHSDAAKGEKSTAEGEHQSPVKSQAEGEQQKQLAKDYISSSSDDDQEGFLDTSFLQEDLLPLIAGEASDVESDDEGNLQIGN